jgi:hypothetical protein
MEPAGEAIERALAAAKAEERKLSERLEVFEAEELRAVEVLRAHRDRLVWQCERCARELAEVDARVVALEAGQQRVALSRRKRLRMLRNVLLRFSLCSVGLVGWLMASTTGIGPETGLLLFMLQLGSVWWLADFADHLELRDG